MTNLEHVKNDLTRSLLEGRAPACKVNLSIVLSNMLREQGLDCSNIELPEEVFWARADALDEAIDAYGEGDIALCMNRVKTFYLT